MYGFCTPFDDISRLLTLCHGMSRCLTLSTVYVRHLAVSVHNFVVSATQMCQFANRVWKGRRSEYFSFFPVDLPQVPSAPLLFCCSIIVVKCSWGLGSCSWQSIDELLLWNLVSWHKRRKSNTKKPQRSRYKDEIPDFLFAEGLERRRKSKKMKSQRSRYKDEMPVFISRLTGI